MSVNLRIKLLKSLATILLITVLFIGNAAAQNDDDNDGGITGAITRIDGPFIEVSGTFQVDISASDFFSSTGDQISSALSRLKLGQYVIISVRSVGNDLPLVADRTTIFLEDSGEIIGNVAVRWGK